jgi:hypothetical protein
MCGTKPLYANGYRYNKVGTNIELPIWPKHQLLDNMQLKEQHQQPSITYKASWDKINIAVALACMLHCILLPVLFTTLPLWGWEILENLYLEWATSGTALVAGGWAMRSGYQYHCNKLIPLLFILGIALMAGANFVGEETLEMTGKGVAAYWLLQHMC